LILESRVLVESINPYVPLAIKTAPDAVTDIGLPKR